jgi:hypothetical protein
VSEWSLIWLGTMAIALVVMAVVQIAVLIGAMRVGRDLLQTTQELRREIKPLVEKAHKVTDDANRVSTLAIAQMERLDGMLATTAVRVDETITVLQQALVQPIRQGAAVFAAIRAVASGLRGAVDRDRGHRDEEDALFVG